MTRLVYSPAEVADMLGLHVNTVLRWLASGKMPGRKVGGVWLVSDARLRAWVEATPDHLVQPAATDPVTTR
jgi:excisionase family DNA binding protein